MEDENNQGFFPEGSRKMENELESNDHNSQFHQFQKKVEKERITSGFNFGSKPSIENNLVSKPLTSKFHPKHDCLPSSGFV